MRAIAHRRHFGVHRHGALGYAGLLGLCFFVLSVRVILGRVGPDNPSLGDGGQLSLQRRIRAHANFAEYVPLTLLLIALLEYTGNPPWIIHGLAVLLLIGRVLHGYAMAFTANHPFGRSVGIGLSLLSLLLASGLAVFRVFTA